MARNKYPQETVDKILDTAQRLFLTQGYEHTSIQDIIDGLGGLTRGAVYHHFKSKEDILTAVMDRMFQGKRRSWRPFWPLRASPDGSGCCAPCKVPSGIPIKTRCSRPPLT